MTALFVPVAVSPVGTAGSATVGVADASVELAPTPEELVAWTT